MAEARDHVERAAALFTELGMDTWLADAERELGSLAST